jgi:hypothetical protein
MGVEMKADPGIHLLVIFDESSSPDDVSLFLAEAYGAPYDTFAGDPTPTAGWTVRETLDRIHAKFQESAYVIFPHVDSSGGVYEDLKDFQQIRISALTHPIVKALSFNKIEARDKLVELLSKPEYKRNLPLALIQSSDFHGESGTTIGQPRTEVDVRDGKPTFKNLKEAFREKRVKCSVDFVEEEYSRLIEGQYLCRHHSQPGEFGFKECDSEEIARSICGMLNSSGGIVEIAGTPAGSVSDEELITGTKDRLAAICEKWLDPPFIPNTFRVFRTSATRGRLLCRVSRARRLYTVEGKVFIEKAGKCEVAKSHEVEALAAGKVARRYGMRFETTLDQVAETSKLLSKLLDAVPLVLKNQTKVGEGIPKSITIVKPPLLSGGSAEVHDLIEELEEKQKETYPFGTQDGNCAIITAGNTIRAKEHYMRFTTFRGQVASDFLEKHSWPTVAQPALAVQVAGSVSLVEPGFLICNAPILLIELKDEWSQDILGLLAWIKSSFFIWFCAVCNGEENPFFTFQFHASRVPIPSRLESGFISRLGAMAKQVIEREYEFLDEVNRAKKKGNLDDAYREKLRTRHNTSANAQCLLIDKEIYSYLEVPEGLQRSIGRTLEDLEMTDFGLLQELETNS